MTEHTDLDGESDSGGAAKKQVAEASVFFMTSVSDVVSVASQLEEELDCWREDQFYGTPDSVYRNAVHILARELSEKLRTVIHASAWELEPRNTNGLLGDSQRAKKALAVALYPIDAVLLELTEQLDKLLAAIGSNLEGAWMCENHDSNRRRFGRCTSRLKMTLCEARDHPLIAPGLIDHALRKPPTSVGAEHHRLPHNHEMPTNEAPSDAPEPSPVKAFEGESEQTGTRNPVDSPAAEKQALDTDATAKATPGSMPQSERVEHNPDSGRGTPTENDSGSNAKYMYRKAGANFKVRFQGEEGDVLANFKGAQYISKLLQKPHHPFPAIELHGGVKSDESNRENDNAQKRENLEDMKERASEIKKELDCAKKSKDEPAQNRLCKELKEIAEKIRQNKGLGGRIRSDEDLSSASARASVQTAIKLVVDKCGKDYELPKFAEHLRNYVDTGSDVSYRPLAPPPDWQF